MSIPRAEKTSPATRPKLEHFGAIINELIAIWKRPGKIISAPWAHPRVLLFDLHAATGQSVEGRDGSALIMLRNMLANEVPFEAWLFERNRRVCSELRNNVVAMLRDDELHEYRRRSGHARQGPCVEVCPLCRPDDLEAWIAAYVHIVVGDHNDTIDDVLTDLRERLTKPAYGLVVADPYGISNLGQGPLIKISQEPKLKWVDQLVNVAATAAKRGAKGGQFQPAYDLLAPIRKQYCLVRDTLPGGVDHGWNWTMFLFSNWVGFSGSKFAGLGFHDTRSTEGRRLLDRYGVIHRKRSGTAPVLVPFPLTPGTGPTPNTAPILGSESYGPMSSPGAAASANGVTTPTLRRSTT